MVVETSALLLTLLTSTTMQYSILHDIIFESFVHFPRLKNQVHSLLVFGIVLNRIRHV
jgi:hypothetical protein